MDFSWISNPESWIALVTLIALELVLGVDNVIFISILSGKLPQEDQQRARTTGISLAVITRVLLLLSLSWIIGLTEPLLHLPFFEGEVAEVTGRDLILLLGGLFLLWKSTHEIHDKLEGKEGSASAKVAANFVSVIIQIMLLDIVFSLDSVITAVGIADNIIIMIVAVVAAAVVMIFTAKPIGDFVERHPTIKILALSFLLMIGFTLIAEGFGVEIPKGYVYFAIGFSVMVEMLNLRVRDSHVKPVNLRDPYKEEKVELQPALVATTKAATVTAEKLTTSPAKKTSTKTKAKPKSKAKKS